MQCTSKIFSKHTDYNFETKNVNICEKKLFLTIFVKNSFFFRAKHFFDSIFFEEITKKVKNDYQMKVGIKLGKVNWLGHPSQNGG